MSFYKLWSSRVKGSSGDAKASEFVGETGRLFYDDNDRTIRISDGVTPGGLPYSSFVSIDYTNARQGYILVWDSISEEFKFSPNTSGGGGTGTNLAQVSIPLSGTSASVLYSSLVVDQVVSAVVLDPSGLAVEVVMQYTSTQLDLDSNIDLLDHTLQLTYSPS